MQSVSSMKNTIITTLINVGVHVDIGLAEAIDLACNRIYFEDVMIQLDEALHSPLDKTNKISYNKDVTNQYTQYEEDTHMLATVAEHILIDDIKEKWYKVVDFSTIPDSSFKSYPHGYVFDEEKSVKWNREELERVNAEYHNERDRLRRAYSDLYNEANDLTLKYIMQETRMNVDQAKILWLYVDREYHHDLYELFEKLDEFIDLHNDIAKADKEENR